MFKTFPRIWTNFYMRARKDFQENHFSLFATFNNKNPEMNRMVHPANYNIISCKIYVNNQDIEGNMSTKKKKKKKEEEIFYNTVQL